MNKKITKNQILSIVIPCFNEEKNIPILVENIQKSFSEENFLKNNLCPIKIILINNGSTDNTADVLKSLSGKYSFLEIYSLNKNKGYGYGILQGLNYANTAYIGWTHADLQADPLDCIKAFKEYENLFRGQNVFIKDNRKNRL